MVYKDKRGYERNEKEHTNLVHRNRIYHVYLENRKRYPLPFSAYEVHHKDFNKNNNKVNNLQIVTPTEHDRIHEEENKRREKLEMAESQQMLFEEMEEKRLKEEKEIEENRLKVEKILEEEEEKRRKNLSYVEIRKLEIKEKERKKNLSCFEFRMLELKEEEEALLREMKGEENRKRIKKFMEEELKKEMHKFGLLEEGEMKKREMLEYAESTQTLFEEIESKNEVK